MNLEALWARTAEYSDDVTKNSRQLALGGVAVCWILKDPHGLDFGLLCSLGFFCLFFFLDVAQGCVAFLIRRVWLHGVEEKRHATAQPINAEVDQPRWIDVPGFYLFIMKVLALLVAYLFVITHVVSTATAMAPTPSPV